MTDQHPLPPPSIPEPQFQLAEQPAAKRRNIAVSVLSVFAVLLFVAAGTFGALWFIERGHHATTTEQLGTARTDAEVTKAGQKAAETKATEAETRWSDATTERRNLVDTNDRNARCAGAGREAIKAATARNITGLENAVQTIMLNCG